MITSNFLQKTRTRSVIAQKGCFSVVEYSHDISVSPEHAVQAYYAAQRNVRKRQIVAELDNSGVIVQAGAMPL